MQIQFCRNCIIRLCNNSVPHKRFSDPYLHLLCTLPHRVLPLWFPDAICRCLNVGCPVFGTHSLFQCHLLKLEIIFRINNLSINQFKVPGLFDKSVTFGRKDFLIKKRVILQHKLLA